MVEVRSTENEIKVLKDQVEDGLFQWIMRHQNFLQEWEWGKTEVEIFAEKRGRPTA